MIAGATPGERQGEHSGKFVKDWKQPMTQPCEPAVSLDWISGKI